MNVSKVHSINSLFLRGTAAGFVLGFAFAVLLLLMLGGCGGGGSDVAGDEDCPAASVPASGRVTTPARPCGPATY